MMKKLSLGLLVALCVAGLLANPSLASSATILDFEDLEDTSPYHTMAAHNPYHEITFHEVDGPYGAYTLNHRNDSGYAIPHSGRVYLFNSYGYDNLYIEFSSLVLFEGAWVSHPIASYLPLANRARDFWFEGYLRAAKVGESAHTALGTTTQWCQANFSRPVDRVVFRRSNQSGQQSPINAFYTLDDITFRPVTAADLVDIMSSDIADLNLPGGVENELAARISATGKIIDDGNVKNDAAAINVLQAFINSVESQRGKQISSGEADELIAKAQEIIDLLKRT